MVMKPFPNGAPPPPSSSHLLSLAAQLMPNYIMSAAPPSESAQQSLAGGVIEIAALTALIGSSTAELLILGGRGAGGVVWASMSIFGVYAVIKACIGAVAPTWLRGTLGVQSAVIDQSIGASLDLRSRRTKSRLELGKAMAIQCAIKKV